VILIARILTVLPASGQQTTKAGESAGIPSSLGWHEIPNTQLFPLCPPDASLQGHNGCRSVIAAWNGGVADDKRNWLVFFGGGHADYGGNEVYALDLNSLKMVRLTNSSLPPPSDCNSESTADGNPVSRHTYGGIAYIESVDKIFLHGGARYPCGGGSLATWIFDEEAAKWTRKDPTNGARIEPTCCNYMSFSAYDRKTDKVYLFDDSKFWSYDYQTNAYTLLVTQDGVDYHQSAVIDEYRRLFLMFGNGQVWSASIADRKKVRLLNLSAKLSGCAVLQNALYPGLAYDSREKAVVGWAGGDSVFLFNPDTLSCTEKKFPGGPGAAQETGTHGRFRYFPGFDIFIVINDWKQNAFALRLSAPDSSRARE